MDGVVVSAMTQLTSCDLMIPQSWGRQVQHLGTKCHIGFNKIQQRGGHLSIFQTLPQASADLEYRPLYLQRPLWNGVCIDANNQKGRLGPPRDPPTKLQTGWRAKLCWVVFAICLCCFCISKALGSSFQQATTRISINHNFRGNRFSDWNILEKRPETWFRTQWFPGPQTVKSGCSQKNSPRLPSHSMNRFYLLASQ